MHRVDGAPLLPAAAGTGYQRLGPKLRGAITGKRKKFTGNTGKIAYR